MTRSLTEDPFFQEVCNHVKEGMVAEHIPGIALGILHQKEFNVAGLGITSVRHSLPVTPNTLFQIGSITKTFVALLVLRLCEAGQLDLETPIKTYLPDLRLADKTTEVQLNVTHLLSHSGGFAGDWFADFGRGADALTTMVANLWQLPQLAPCGRFFGYSNAGFCLLGRLCEVVTNMAFEVALQTQILDPLELNHAYIFPDQVLGHRYAVGHQIQDKQPEVIRPWGISRTLHPAGGLIMDIPGLLYYAQYLMGLTPSSADSELPGQQALQQLFRPHNDQGQPDHSIGLGWFVWEGSGGRLLSHEGGTSGQAALLILVPEQKFAFAMACNTDQGDRLCRTIGQWVLQKYLGIDPPQAPLQALDVTLLHHYAGCYETPMAQMEVTVINHHLTLQLTPKTGFPDRQQLGQPKPAVPLVFYDTDRVFIPEGWAKGLRADFLRDQQGRIRWFRCFSRLYPLSI